MSYKTISDLEILLIRSYRKFSHPVYHSLGKINCNLFKCRFNPSCSYYAEEAITKYGPIIGTIKGLQRIIRCRPGLGPIDDLLK